MNSINRNFTRESFTPLELISQREDGKQQLAVVSHHPNESIEMFELLQKDGWMLEWKGCVDVDGKYYFNDVSLDMYGNFYASHMFESDFSMLKSW